MVTRVLIVASLLLAACEKQSELYCAKHPEDIGNCGYSDAGIDARPPCTSPADCVAPAAVCDLSAGVCVQCVVDQDCTDPLKAQCDTETYECKGCSAHSECASNACLPSGVCGDDTNVAYVNPDGTATTGCTKDDPCRLVDDALAANRTYVKLAGAIAEAITVDAVSRTFLADPDTTVQRGADGVVLAITNGATLTIYDATFIASNESAIVVTDSTARLFRVTVTNANKTDNAAIEANASTLTMSRCVVHNNQGGGIETDASTTYNLTNNMIVRNGKDTSNIGGVVLAATTAGERRFDLNTVVDNRAKAFTIGVAGGVSCAAPDLPIANNLIVRNYAGGATTETGGSNERYGLTTGRCNAATSEHAETAEPYAFIDADGAGAGNYHVGPGSMAIDRGAPSDIGFDIDGQLRPQGTKFDFGADEYRP
jgi:hypothetical protein